MSSPSSIVGRKETLAIKPCQKFEGHTDSVDTIIHLPGGQRMMTCSRDGSLRVWNVKSGKQIGEDYRDPDGDNNIEVRTIALSPDGKKVVSGSLDGGMRLWDIDTGKVIGKWTGHTATVRSVCWSRDGRRVVSGSDDGTARQWDVENGETFLGPIKTGHTNVYTVVYSPDMTMFATAGYYEYWNRDDEYEDKVRIWDAKTSELVATLNGHAHMVNCLAWTPDGKTLISGSGDCSIRTWNTTTWKQIALLKHTDIVYAIAISPNGRILASASFYYMTSQLWNLDNNQPIDGKLLATSGDHNVYTWDVTAIVKEAGLEDLSDQRDNSLLAVRDTFINNSHYM
ncbi:quinon protein alcohol dehydrogenase-like superfamily [Suillus subluteus]|nr:quinon protein alcohol dehydrogenase-like superfamily [Suillus subluteus]